MKKVTKYTTDDGQEFDNYDDAKAHEDSLIGRAEKLFKDYMGRYNGKQLLEKYPGLAKEGIWHVRGEDPNCDFGGYHHMPSLGYYEGKLESVIRHAVQLPGFWQWGAGGDFTLQTPPLVVKVA